ncbi:MAG: NUDIX domain-containing protein [Candidatus Limnocylindria bacterium]
MRRSRRLRLADLPRLLVIGVVQAAHLLGGRHHRFEGAHLLARDAEGRILVVRTTYFGPGWMLPGGRVERGESPHAAAIRETLEETGIRIRVRRLVLVDARRRSVSFVFEGEAIGGELQPAFGEIEEVGWVSRAEIAAESPRLQRLLEWCEAAGDGTRYVGLEAEG